MSSYVLIHGAWHGAWCWQKVIPLLQERGHEVLAPDLAGHGADTTPAGDISLETYVCQVSEALDSGFDRAILVGHSHGGVVITQTAEHRPERIRALVYLSAYLPADGQSLMHLAKRDPDSALIRRVRASDDGLTLHLPPEVAREALYGDCSPEDAAWASSLLVPEPSVSFRTPVSLTPERFGSVPRCYIKCLQDKTITASLQDRMIARSPSAVLTMQAGHSPFLSASEELVEHLLSVPSLLDS